MNQIMEPHSHIVHNRRKHIEFYVKNYVPIVPMWFRIPHGSVIRTVNKFFIFNSWLQIRCGKAQSSQPIFYFRCAGKEIP